MDSTRTSKHRLLSTLVPGLLLAAFTLVATTGCATKKYVREETAAVQSRVDERVDDVETQVEDVQTRVARNEDEIGRVEGEVQEVSQTAQEALDRAMEAGKLAEGKFLYETVLTDEEVKFGFDKASLSPEAETALAEFAEELKSQNRNVYIEIQGHTDDIGTEKYNEELGLERAEAVRRFLSQQGVPLHRMNVISYGEAVPLVEGRTREARAQNRRVSLVVLQ